MLLDSLRSSEKSVGHSTFYFQQSSRVEKEPEGRPISGQLSLSRPDLLQDSGISDSNDDRVSPLFLIE